MSHTDTDRRLKPGALVRVKDTDADYGGQTGIVRRRGRNRDGVYYTVELASANVDFHCSWLEAGAPSAAPLSCGRCGSSIDYDAARRDPKNSEPWCGCP